MNGEFAKSTIGFKLYYFGFIIAGLLFFAFLIPDFPLARFREVLLFVGLIVVADTAQISLPRGGASIYASSPFDLAGIILLGAPAMAVVEALSSFFTEVFLQPEVPIFHRAVKVGRDDLIFTGPCCVRPVMSWNHW